MRRLLVFILAVLLPIQFAWAGAAAYCQHEAGTGRSTHIGHHSHVHQGELKKAADGKTQLADADCNVCNAAGAPLIIAAPVHQAVPAALVVINGLAQRPLPSAHSRAPDRPQWPRLA